jgi:ectoine hydroxylase-related dioxygenase (phytanoyl-CoA dioxygenase family)
MPTSQVVTFKNNPDLALKTYHEVGYHIEPAVLSDQECSEILAAAENLPTYHDHSLKPVMHPHRLEPRFLQALKHPMIVSILEQLVKGKISAIQSQFFFGRPGTPGFTLHQDNFYVQSSQDGFASAWCALTDVDASNGGLIVYPGTHLLPILPMRPVEQPDNFGQDPNANYQESILPAGYTGIDTVVPKGGVVFLHGHVVHNSHKNTSGDRFRQALLLTYIRQGETFRPGYAAQRAEVDVYN